MPDPVPLLHSSCQETGLLLPRSAEAYVRARGHAAQARRLAVPTPERLVDGRRLRIEGPWRVEGGEGFVFRTPDHLRIIVSSDDHPDYGPLLHASLSHLRADPSWADIKAVRYTFFPRDVDVFQWLPRDAQYVNVHPHCFHLWQSPFPWGVM